MDLRNSALVREPNSGENFWRCCRGSLSSHLPVQGTFSSHCATVLLPGSRFSYLGALETTTPSLLGWKTLRIQVPYDLLSWAPSTNIRVLMGAPLLPFLFSLPTFLPVQILSFLQCLSFTLHPPYRWWEWLKFMRHSKIHLLCVRHVIISKSFNPSNSLWSRFSCCHFHFLFFPQGD